MMRYNFTFICRDSKADRNGKSPIEMTIGIGGKRANLTLPLRLKPEQFRKEINKRSGTARFCECYEEKARQAIASLMQAGIPVTTATVRNRLKTGTEASYTIEKLFDDYAKVLALRHPCKRTMQRYAGIRDMLIKKIGQGCDVSCLTSDLVTDFYLDLNKKYEISTSGGMMTKFKAVVVYAMNTGRIATNPFVAVKINKGKPKKEWLTEEELERIRTKELTSKRLEGVRDIFIFQAATGLSYADVCLLSPENINERDGVYYISGTRKKTGIAFCTVILPEGVEILQKYQGRLPLISNQKLNSYLGELESICEIGKHLHTHLARKTFATRMRQAGYRTSTIARFLGHSNSSITESTYAFLDADAIIDEVRIRRGEK